MGSGRTEGGFEMNAPAAIGDAGTTRSTPKRGAGITAFGAWTGSLAATGPPEPLELAASVLAALVSDAGARKAGALVLAGAAFERVGRGTRAVASALAFAAVRGTVSVAGVVVPNVVDVTSGTVGDSVTSLCV
jgi:hypothetical protein